MSFVLVQPEVKLDTREWLRAMKYELITDETRLREWCGTLVDGQDLGADWETDRLNRFTRPKAVGFGMARDKDDACYLPIAHTTDPHLNLPLGLIVELLQELDRRRINSIWWHYAYDSSVHIPLGLNLEHWQDAMVATWIWDTNLRDYRLKPLARKLLGIPVIEYDQVTTGRQFHELSPIEATAYVCGDSNNALQIWRKVTADPWFIAQRSVYLDIERPFLPVLRDESAGGVAIDGPYFEQVNEQLGLMDENDVPLGGILKQTYDLVREYAGGEINLRSTPQIGEMLKRLGVPIIEETDTGQVATGKDVLAQYEHPVCKAITNWREAEFLKNVVTKVIDARNHFNEDWLRFPYRQMGAPTGLLACGSESKRPYEDGTTPMNAQALPKAKKGKSLPDIRKGFVAMPAHEPGAEEWSFVSIDYSQFQMRIAANLSKEPAWVKAFIEGHDFHMANANMAYGADVSTIEDARDHGKTMSFAILFDATDATVAAHAGISVEKAHELTSKFRRSTPVLQQKIKYWKDHARQHGYIATHLGRRRRLDAYYNYRAGESLQREGDRLAINTPIQGTEADLFKVAATKVHKLCQERGWGQVVRQVMWNHDELSFRMHNSVRDEAVKAIVQRMEFQLPDWPVKITVDPGVGRSWSEAKGKG
jgi:DNA polymerase-1